MNALDIMLALWTMASELGVTATVLPAAKRAPAHCGGDLPSMGRWHGADRHRLHVCPGIFDTIVKKGR